MSPALDGIKVVELAAVLAGPAVGMFLAELGATVVKVENKTTGGDMTRHWKLPSEDPALPYSAYFCSVNWGKQHLFLDLTDPKDRDVLDPLLAEADIVIANFKPGFAQRIGLDAPTLRQRYPRLIYAEINGFGPDDDRPAFDVVLQAEAGFLYMTGHPGQPPVKMPVALIDLLAAHQLKEGILLALYQRLQHGKGAEVRVSLYAAALASLANQASNWLMAGHIPQPMGTAHPNIAPYGDTFLMKDEQYVVLAVGTDKQFLDLLELLGLASSHPQLRFTTNDLRVRHRTELLALLSPALRQWEASDFLQACEQKGIPAAAIKNMKEVFSQPEAQQWVLEDQLPDGTIGKRVKTAVFELLP